MSARVLFGVLSVCFASGACAAEVYVSLGLGIAEDRIDLHSTAPSFSETCNATPFSLSCAGRLTSEPVTAGFDLGNTAASTASLGLEWESWRLEVEYGGRKHDGQSLPQSANPIDFLAGGLGFGAIGGGGTIGLPIGFLSSGEPRHEIANFSSHKVFLNALYSFRTGVSWRPYVGLGAGVARISYRYLSEGIELEILPSPVPPSGTPRGVFDPGIFSARTVTAMDSELRDNVLGFQVLAGIDRTLSEEVSAFATLRWSRFEASSFSNLPGGNYGSDLPSLTPTLVLGTPSPAPHELDGIGGFSLTAGIRYTF